MIKTIAIIFGLTVSNWMNAQPPQLAYVTLNSDTIVDGKEYSFYFLSPFSNSESEQNDKCDFILISSSKGKYYVPLVDLSEYELKHPIRVEIIDKKAKGTYSLGILTAKARGLYYEDDKINSLLR